MRDNYFSTGRVQDVLQFMRCVPPLTSIARDEIQTP